MTTLGNAYPAELLDPFGNIIGPSTVIQFTDSTAQPSTGSGSTLPTGGAASQVVGYGGSSGTGSWVYPPGYEINYTAITANANVTDTSEATATALISPGAVTFDGTAVFVEFFCATALTDTAAVGDLLTVTLFEGATQITRLCQMSAQATTANGRVPLHGRYRFTPTAASHTYKVCAFTTSTTGTPLLAAGNGGTGTYPPAFVRFTKV